MHEKMITARINVPDELWRRVRAAALTDDRKNEDVLREALERWLQSRKEAGE
jgi:predicted transcriptional regulator